MTLRKGDLVRVSGDPLLGIAFIVKGPYEAAYREFKLTSLVLVYDVYFEGGTIMSLPARSLEKIHVEEDESPEAGAELHNYSERRQSAEIYRVAAQESRERGSSERGCNDYLDPLHRCQRSSGRS